MSFEKGKAEPQLSGSDPGHALGAIVFAGQNLVADRTGALYWPEQQVLIIADLHLEKGSAFAERGRMLPPYDTRETLFRLAGVIDHYAPRTVIALGDSLHDRGAEVRIARSDLELIYALQSGRDWIWISGNHDPSISPVLGGRVAKQIEIAGLTMLHAPEHSSCRREIAGHLHPVCKIVRRAQAIRRSCFVCDGHRLILPAYGAFTGGLNVLDAAFAPLFRATEPRVWMLGHDGVYPLAMAQLTPD